MITCVVENNAVDDYIDYEFAVKADCTLAHYPADVRDNVFATKL